MNIFLLSPGLGVYSVQLAQGLSTKDRVTIALNDTDAFNLKSEFPDFFTNSRFETIALPHYAFPNPRKFLQVLQIFRKIVHHKTGIIHILVSGTYIESFLAVWLARKTGYPLVATLHDTKVHPGDFVRLHSTWLNFKALELCSQIIVHGEHLANDLINSFGIDKRYIKTIPHGNYDIYLKAKDAQIAAQPNPGQILLFGRMKKYKGLDILARATPMIAEKIPNLKVILAGQGPELDRLGPQLSSNPYFEIHNRYIPAGEVAELFSKSSLVVIPYIEASQSGPLHLAYTFGRPVVATEVGAIPESLNNGGEGLLVPPNNPEALADAIIKILQNPDRAARFGRAGRRKADTQLDWATRIGEMTREAYQTAMMIQHGKIDYPGMNSKKRWHRIKANYYRELGNDRKR